MLRSSLVLQSMLRRFAATSNTAAVLAAHGAPMINIELQFGVDGQPPVSKSLLRPRDESLGKTLSRMRMLLTAPRGKGTKKQTPADIVADLPAAVLLNGAGNAISEETLNSDAWAQATTLVLGPSHIRVKYNLPTVTSIIAPQVVYAGLPAVCHGIKIIFSQQSELLSEWYVAEDDGRVTAGAQPFAVNTLVVTPKAEWAGKPLVFRCRPNTGDAPWAEVTTPAVVLDAAGFVAMPRWSNILPKAADEIRVVSYNVLHDGYAMSKEALARVYPFCTKDVLNILYRRSRIAQELQQYGGDILCLQEVGREVHDRYYNEVLSHWGFKSLLAIKTGSTKEGCGIAYRKDRFEPLTTGPVVMPLSWGTLSRRHPELAAEINADHPHVEHGLRKLPSVGIFVALRDKVTGKNVVVSNTHLYYHPDGCHIRALQLYVFMKALMEYSSTLEGGAGIIACGDYNLTRITGGYRLVTRGRVTPEDDCWLKGLRHYFGIKAQDKAEVLPQSEGDSDDDAEDVERAPMDAAEVEHASFMSRLQTPPTAPFAPTLSLPMKLYDTHPTDASMKFTNYALSFKACIDHIFVSEGLTAVRTLPPPSEDELSKDVAIPSLMFPSDHVALVADVAWR